MMDGIQEVLDMEIGNEQVPPGKYTAKLTDIFVVNGTDRNNQPCKLLVVKTELTEYDHQTVEFIRINDQLMWKIRELGNALGMIMPYTISDMCHVCRGTRLKVLLKENPNQAGQMYPVHYCRYAMDRD